MRLSHIRDAAATAIYKRHPKLIGLVSFDLVFHSVSLMHTGFDLIVRPATPSARDSIRELADSESAAGLRPSWYPRRKSSLGLILDHYCSNEPELGYDFELERLHWLIGDGDDSLALHEIDNADVALWVRTFS